MNRRALTILITALLVLGAAPLSSLAIPDDADQDYAPDTVETVLCDPGDGDIGAGPANIGACAEGDFSWSETIEGGLAAICASNTPIVSRCVDGYYGGPTSSNETDQIWADLQYFVIDFAFEQLAETLGAAGIDMSPATDADGNVVDVDEDGSPDAWNVTVEGNHTWIPSDFFNGPPTDTNPIIPAVPGVPGVPGVPETPELPGGGGGEPGSTSAGVVNITDDGNGRIYINISDDPDDDQAVIATLTFDQNELPDPMDPVGRNRWLTLDLVGDGQVNEVNIPGFSLYWAPLDFNHLVLSDPNDIDGDGHVTGAEHFTGSANGHLPSNPVNRLSIPGDADADGCPYSDEGDGDTDARVDPCTILPYAIDLLDIGGELGHPENIIWDLIDADIRIENITGTSFNETEAKIESWEIWWADTDSNSAVRKGTICSEETHGNISVVDGVLEFACDWDSNEAPDTQDYLTSQTPPQRVDNYWAFFEICLAADECVETEDGLDFIVQNLPSLRYDSIEDYLPLAEDPDREGAYSGRINFTVESEHPAYDITEFELQTRSRAQYNTAGQITGGLGGITPGPWISLGNFSVDDPIVHRLVNETGVLTDNYTFVIDTRDTAFPKADAPRDPRAPRQELEGLPFMNGLEQQWTPFGNQFRTVARHADGDERMGEVQQSDDSPFTGNGTKIFNNRAPEISEFDFDPVDAEADLWAFTFHYYDADGTGTTEAKVNVDGTDVTCEQVPANQLDELGTGAVQWIDNPAEFSCEWDASGSGEGPFDWTVLVLDADGPETPLSFLADIQIDLGNAAPDLSGASHAETTIPDPLANGTKYTFRVHYSDPTDAPGVVTITLEDAAGVLESRTVEMSQCPIQDDPLAVLEGDGTEVDFCVDIVLPAGTEWIYAFAATDARDKAAEVVPDPKIVEVPDIICDHCVSEGTALQEGASTFDAAINTLNEQGILMPVNGHTFGEETTGGEFDDDGDFVPGLVEATLLNVDIFTVDPETNVATFEEEWVIEVYEPEGSGVISHSILSVTISGQEEAPFYSLDVCSGPEEGDCVLHDESISMIHVETTPQGFLLDAFDVDGVLVLSIVIDAAKLGYVTEAFAAIFVDGVGTAYVMTNPFDVIIDDGDPETEDDGLAPDEPTIGIDRSATGGFVVYLDPDGEGDAERIESGDVDPNAVDPNDFLGPIDDDGDNYPDAIEPTYCSVVGSFLGGQCVDGDYQP